MAAVDLASIRWGSGGERRILLLHGITAAASGWWRVGPDLADHGWDVTAVDLRGHGDSPATGSYLFSHQVDDLLALGGGWDAVLGHSMGGNLAVLAATVDAGWAMGLVLQDPALMLPEPQSEILDWLLGEYAVDADPERIAEMSPRWHPRDVEEKVAALRASSSEMITQIVVENWPWMALDEAANLTTPMVILGSDPETGGILPVAFGEWLASSPTTEYEMIPRSSHSTHRDDDQYDTYRSTLVAALDRLPTLVA
jgi:pimeloyl-ACP methyl ester carboxylesterase